MGFIIIIIIRKCQLITIHGIESNRTDDKITFLANNSISGALHRILQIGLYYALYQLHL